MKNKITYLVLLAITCVNSYSQVVNNDLAGYLQPILKLEQADGVRGANPHAAIRFADVEAQLVQQLLSLANGINIRSLRPFNERLDWCDLRQGCGTLPSGVLDRHHIGTFGRPLRDPGPGLGTDGFNN